MNNLRDFLFRYFKYILFRKKGLLKPDVDVFDVNEIEVETTTRSTPQISRKTSVRETVILLFTWFLLIVGGISFLILIINWIFFPNKPTSCFLLSTFSSILGLFIGSLGTALDLDSKP